MPNSSTLQPADHNLSYAQLFPAALFLFILPFTHTMALRLTALTVTLGICTWLWFRQPHPNLPLKLPLALWAGLAAISITWSINPDYSGKEFKHEILFGIATLFCFFILTRSNRELKLFLYTLIAAIVTMGCMAIYNWLPKESWDSTGPQGGVGSFSTYMLLTLPWLLACLFLNRSRHITKIVVAIAIVIAISTTYLTLNRAFWPALFIELTTILLFAILAKRYHLSSKSIITIVVLLTVITTTTIFTLVSVINEKKHQEIDTVEEVFEVFASDARLPIWHKASEHFQQHPWLGLGYGLKIATLTPEQEELSALAKSLTQTNKKIRALTKQRKKINKELKNLEKNSARAKKLSNRSKAKKTEIKKLKQFRRQSIKTIRAGAAWPNNLEHAHNTIINYAIQLGIAGVLVFLILFGSLIREFYRHTQDKLRETRIIAISMLALTLGFLMKNMTDDFFHRDLALLFWASMGMSLGYIHWSKFQRAETPT